MKWNNYYLLAAACISFGASADAVVIVDGTGAGANYATLQEAVDAVLASTTETTIEIHTNSLAAGASIPEGTTLARPLTIEAGTGFSPVINGTLTIMPNNEDQVVTLNNLTVAPTTDNTDALVAAGTINAHNCTFDGGPAVSAGILAANTSFGTTGNLSLTSCTLNGWYALVVGRAIEDYDLVDCFLYTEENGFQHGIVHFGNQPIHRGSGVGLEASIPDDGIHAAAVTPRTLDLERCVIQAGRPLAWPVAVAGFPNIYADFGDTLGPITATNTVFRGFVQGSIIILGWFDMPAHTQSHTFTHCTFRNAGIVPDAGAPPSEPSGSTIEAEFTNSIFDIPGADAAAIAVYYYAIDGYKVGTVNLTGDANVYNTPPFSQHSAYGGNTHTRILEVDAAPFDAIPNFETTYYARVSEAADDFITSPDGHLLTAGEVLAANKAIDLVPAVLLDFERQIRPQGGLNDIGADEAGAVTSVNDWSVY